MPATIKNKSQNRSVKKDPKQKLKNRKDINKNNVETEAKSSESQENSDNGATENSMEVGSRENVYYWEDSPEIETIRDAGRFDADAYDIQNDLFIRNAEYENPISQSIKSPVTNLANINRQFDIDNDDDLVVGDHRKTYPPQEKRYSNWIRVKNLRKCNPVSLSPPRFCTTVADKLWDDFVANNPDLNLPPESDRRQRQRKSQRSKNESLASKRNDQILPPNQSELATCFKKILPIALNAQRNVNQTRKKRKSTSLTEVANVTPETEASTSRPKRKFGEMEVDDNNSTNEFIEAPESGTPSRCKTSQEPDEIQMNDSSDEISSPTKSTRKMKRKSRSIGGAYKNFALGNKSN